MNNFKSKYSAFSLVEAMIILVLVSVAVMALIPLITQKTTLPKWKIEGTEADTHIFYGNGPNDRVGLNEVNPYEKGAKLALKNLAVNYTANNNSIAWGSMFSNSAYSKSGTIPNGSVRIGMNNSCTKANEIAIGSNITNCNNDINIGNRIIKNGKTTAISNTDISNGSSLAEKSIIYLSSNGSGDSAKDTFRINYLKLKFDNVTKTYIPDTPDLAMEYNNGTLNINKGLTVNGDIYLLDYTVSIAATGGYNLQCDTLNNEDCQEYVTGSPSYRDTAKRYTFEDSAKNIKKWTISDIRLKNIISSYNKGIDDISKVDTYSFTYKNDKKQKTYVGIIAQKLIGLFDIALHKDSKGYYSYEKTPLLYALTNSVKEINDKQKKIEQQQKAAAKEADKLIKMYK